MRIAFFSDTFQPQTNGVVVSLSNLARGLAGQGHECLVFAPWPGHGKPLDLDEHVKVEWLDSLRFPPYPEYRMVFPVQFRVLPLLREFKPDLVHVHTPFSVGLIGAKAAQVLGKPLVGTYHTLIPEFRMYSPVPWLWKLGFVRRLAWAYTNWFYGQCDLVSTPSEAMKRELERNGLKAAALKVVSNGIDLGRFRRVEKPMSLFPVQARAFKFVYFGRVSYEKSIDVLLKAFARLVKANPGRELQFVVVGSGPAEAGLKALAGRQGVGERVLFTGLLKDQALLNVLSACDAFVTASTIETQGLTVLEAMAVGLPVLAADYLALPEAVKHDYNGLLFKPFNVRDATEKMQWVLDSPELRKKLVSNARDFVQQHDFQNVLGQWEKIYAGLAGV